MLHRAARFLGVMAMCATGLWAWPLDAQEKGSTGSRAVATVSGKAITEAELNKAAAAELEKLEMQRLQYEAGYARNRQQVLQTNLDRLIEARLLAAEAAKLAITEKELIAREVDAKVKPPTDEEINAFYESNKARISQPKEQVTAQIQQYLQRQANNIARTQLIERLKQEYAVASYLEPLRMRVESAGHPSRGPANAPVTIVEFSDFQCSYCKTMASTLREVDKNYPGEVRLVFRQFPIAGLHPNAPKAAEASLCAAEQGRFWEMHDLMFEDQSGLKEEDLKAKAARLQLDAAAFAACLNSGRYADKIKQDLRDGALAGVSGTPAVFINGRFLSGAQPYQEMAKTIDEELKKTREKR